MIDLRNVNLDLARVLFALAVVSTHAFKLGFDHNYGFLAVEFFFFVTGYFLAANVDKHHGNNKTTGEFLKGKYKSFIIIFISAEILSVISGWAVSSYIAEEYDLSVLFFNFAMSVEELLCLQMTNIPCFTGTGIGWYFSAMILGSALLYPIVVRFRNFSSGVAPVIGVLLLGLVYTKCWGSIANNTVMIYVVPSGLLRGIGDMCLGLYAYTWTNKIRNTTFTKKGRIALTVLEITTLVVSLLFMFGYRDDMFGNNQLQFPVIFLIWIFTVVLLSEKSHIHISNCNKTMQKISPKLGTLSLLILFNHYWVFKYIYSIYPDESSEFLICISIILVVIAMIACYVLYRVISYICSRSYTSFVTKDQSE